MDARKPAKVTTNNRKVLICRILLLLTIVCFTILLLVTMLSMPEENSDISSPQKNVCVTFDCTIHAINGSFKVRCTERYQFSRTRNQSSCLNFTLRCRNIEKKGKHESGSESYFNDNHSKGTVLCLNNTAEFQANENNLGVASNLIRDIIKKDFHVYVKCRSVTTTRKQIACRERSKSQKDSDSNSSMIKNTRVAAFVLAVTSSFALLCCLVMCFFTRKVLAYCCNMCYEE